MKNLIKELAKREGKKSQVKVGDLRETMSKFQDIIAEEMVLHIEHAHHGKEFKDVYAREFLPRIADKINKLLKKKKLIFVCTRIRIDQQVDWNPEVSEKKGGGNVTKKSKASKKKA